MLKDGFKMKDLGPVHYILGISVVRDREKKEAFMSQERYLKELIQKTGMTDCKPSRTPMVPNLQLRKNECDEVDKAGYQSVIGSLMYAALATRPDLCQPVGVLAQFVSSPGQEHWAALKQVLRYVNDTTKHGLLFTKGSKSEIDIEGFVDADWAGNPDNRRSTTGYAFYVCENLVSWRSKLQEIVALSSTEAEYVAACQAVQEVASDASGFYFQTRTRI
jgi:hypothetical protein